LCIHPKSGRAARCRLRDKERPRAELPTSALPHIRAPTAWCPDIAWREKSKRPARPLGYVSKPIDHSDRSEPVRSDCCLFARPAIEGAGLSHYAGRVASDRETEAWRTKSDGSWRIGHNREIDWIRERVAGGLCLRVRPPLGDWLAGPRAALCAARRPGSSAPTRSARPSGRLTAISPHSPDAGQRDNGGSGAPPTEPTCAGQG